MKIKPNYSIILLMLAAMVFSLVSCDTRPIPGDSILTMYNSNLEETREFSPMDTLYVKVAGMKPNKFYRISLLDSDKKLVTKLETRTNEDGIIDPVALWFDMGLKKEDPNKPPTLVWPTGIQPSAFKIKVESIEDNGKSTNFTQDMWIIYTKAGDRNPQPVLYACSSEDETDFYPDNAFKETGTLTADGSPDHKTKVYVKADLVPQKNQTPKNGADKVDFYVLKYTGNTFRDGDPLYDTDRFVTKITADVTTLGDGRRVVNGTLLWDLNDSPKVINPDQDTMAYSIVMDVNQDGKFDAGIDTDDDGVADHFIDGVDGNSTPGFIIQNTPANDWFVKITDEEGNEVNAIPEKDADEKRLDISINNVPLAHDKKIRIFVIESGETGETVFSPSDVRGMGTGGNINIGLTEPTPTDKDDLIFLPYVKDQKLINTKTAPGDTYTYSSLPVTEDRKLDIVIDIDNNGVFDPGVDHFIKDAITILHVPPSSVYTTCTDADGQIPSQYFKETNGSSDTVVYLKSEQKADEDKFDAYLYGNKNWTNGETLRNPILKKSFKGNGVNSFWDLDTEFNVINPTIANNTFNIVIDENVNGVFDADDTVLTVVILNTNANTYPRVSYVNIASGADFGNTWYQHWTLYSEYCDYRDFFNSDGRDTNPAYSGYGVKAVFNPYFSWFDLPNPEIEIEGLYYGLYVDVYIVDAETFDLADFGNHEELKDSIDVTGRHSTVVIQPTCYNGAGMINIWPAPMKPGRYYVIVDVNRNGRIDEGVDIIDAVREDGTTILDDPSVVGFTVR